VSFVGEGLMLTFRSPSPDLIRAFLARQRELPLSYGTEGMTRGQAPCGFNVNHLRHRLGTGDDVFERACAKLRSWSQFRLGWVRLEPTAVEPMAGAVVAIIARVGLCWWSNACRVIYRIEEAGPPRRFGFAYGTLADHAERGEERFCVELGEDGAVWYDLLAYSRPRHWLTWLGYPLSRWLQRRFAVDSAAALETAVIGPAYQL
jgi:uncharacterized protein (UPF0548 family)